MSIFSFCSDDLHVDCSDHPSDSEFEKLLQTTWLDPSRQNCFRYNLGELQSKVLDGRFGFIAQLNPERGTLRRKPEDLSSMNTLYSADGFNFNKVSSLEIMFELKDEDQKDLDMESRIEVLINNSPLEFCHSLIVPDREKGLPQVLTLNACEIAVKSLLLSNSLHFRVAFNSLCAHASVNHLHFHIWYLKHELFLESIPPQRELAPYLYLVRTVPYPAFMFVLCEVSRTLSICHMLFTLCNFLQVREIAHNLFLTRGKPLTSSLDSHACSDLSSIVRIFVWPRKHTSGSKNESAFNVAVAELGGHLVVKDADAYSKLTEDFVLNQLAAEALDAGHVGKLIQDITSLFNS